MTANVLWLCLVAEKQALIIDLKTNLTKTKQCLKFAPKQPLSKTTVISSFL